jgi:sugar (pentulose or hexulose) kinase
MEAGFTGQDLVLLKSLKYDPSLKPAYESIKGCLIWEDERADELCKELWAQAQQQISEWPGFKRLTLSAEDKEYFEDQIARAEREDL